MTIKKLFFLLLPIFFLGCQEKEDQGKKLIENIDYWVPIGKPIEETYNIKELPNDSKEWFLNEVMEKVKNQTLKTYYYLPDTLMPYSEKDLEYFFFHVDTEYIENNQGVLEKILIEEKFDYNDICRLKFRENWYFNSKTNVMTKKIIAIAPMVVRFKNIDEILGYKGLFWIYLNQ